MATNDLLGFFNAFMRNKILGIFQIFQGKMSPPPMNYQHTKNIK